ncbi:hypothetical protein DACRYDRAFT_115753 [Dacryopinax primogenitus]|uniref:TPR-like protein n=1 Tax=Dacryopinax primogenitus (strain DJM 731) TaxID=1858805 RepID=M5GDX2_DACPD|nr:uncharacterized protein DACRYDRAFT_115753 [Dacryopinax primogenitus]EJU02768.1 hypothetical protein DACRYDRAFT_115753 [Dacryopinax primogenitus]
MDETSAPHVRLSDTDSEVRGAAPSFGATWKRWKSKATGGLELGPVKEKLEYTAMKVLGIADMKENIAKDCQELASKVIWVTERVLERVPPEGPGDAAAEQLIHTLTQSISKIDCFLKHPPSDARQRISEARAAKFQENNNLLDELRLQYLASAHDETRVDVLSESMSRALVPQGPSDSPILDIPPIPTAFHGRNELVASIVQLLLQPEPSRIPLLGTGGIGKTSVACAAMNDARVKDHYGKHIYFLSCEGLLSAEGIIMALLAMFNVQATNNTRAAVIGYLHLMGRALLALDNLETTVQADRQHVEELLGRLSNLRQLSFIITMRGMLPPDGVEWDDVSPLGALSLDASREIWAQIAKKSDGKLDELLQHLDGLPLAIRLLARQGRMLMPTALLAAYESQRTKMLKVGTRGRLENLEVSIKISLESELMLQNSHALSLLSALSLLPDGVKVEKLVEIIPSMSDHVLVAASVLLQVGMVHDESGRLRILSPIRDYMLEHHPPADPWLENLQTYFMVLAARIPIYERQGSPKSFEVIHAELANITSVLLHLWQGKTARYDSNHLVDFTDYVAYFSSRTSTGDTVPLLRKATTTAKIRGNRYLAARCSFRLAKILYLRNESTEAVSLLGEVKAAFHTVNEQLSEARCTEFIGRVLRTQTRYEESTLMVQEAKALFEDIGNRHGTALCTQDLAEIMHGQGRLDEAANMLQEAKASFEAISMLQDAARYTRSLGTIRLTQGRYDEATHMLQNARTSFRAVNHRLGEAQCTQGLGQVFRMRGRYEEARHIIQEAKVSFESVGNCLGAAQCMQSLGNMLLMQAEYDDAAQMLQDAKVAFEAVGAHLGATQCSTDIGSILFCQGWYDDAGHMFQDAKKTFEVIGDRLGATQCMATLGEILTEQACYEEATCKLQDAKALFEAIGTPASGRHHDAIHTLHHARRSFESIGSRNGMAHSMRSLADALRRQGRYVEAAHMLAEAKSVFESMADHSGVAECLRISAVILRMQNQCQQGIERLQAARSIFTRIGRRADSANCNMDLGYTLTQQGSNVEARRMFEQAKETYDQIRLTWKVKEAAEALENLENLEIDQSEGEVADVQ